MAILETGIYAYVAGSSVITGLVSDRIFPAAVPQNETFPAVTFYRIASDQPHSLTPQELALSTAVTGSTGQTGAATSITLSSLASSADDTYNHHRILLTAGTGSGQWRIIQDYTGATRVADIAPDWVTTPASDTQYTIYQPNIQMSRIQFDCWGKGRGGYEDASEIAEAIRDRLDGYRGMMGKVRIRTSHLIEQRDDYDAPKDGTDVGTFRISQEYLLWYSVSQPQFV